MLAVSAGLQCGKGRRNNVWDDEDEEEEDCESVRDVFWVCQAFTGLYLGDPGHQSKQERVLGIT